MPSSISSSDGVATPAIAPAAGTPAARSHDERPGFVRLTASDRPGVAQPVPVRDIPAQPWARIFVAMLVLCALMLAGWEAYWRAWSGAPGYRNSNGEWAEQRRRIDQGEAAAPC